MEYQDDRIHSFSEVTPGQNFLYHGTRCIKIHNQNGTDNALRVDSAVTFNIPDTDEVTDIADTAVHSI